MHVPFFDEFVWGRVSVRGGCRLGGWLTYLAEDLIKWGVVQMPAAFYEEMANAADIDLREAEVGHFSFGVLEDDVKQPIDGCWYA